MKNQITCLERDNECENLAQEISDLQDDIDNLSDLIMEVYGVCLEAHEHLNILEIEPKRSRLIIEDYLEKIESMCFI